MSFVELFSGKNQVKCPRCGNRLNRNRLRRNFINRCPKGCGVWIDQHQLDQLVGTKTRRYDVTNDLPAESWENWTAV